MRIYILILLFNVSFIPFATYAQWIQSGLMGTKVNDIEILDKGAGGTTLFAGTDNGIYRSTDNGINWDSTPLLGNNNISKLAFYNNDIIAAASFIFRSTDNGTSWKEINFGINLAYAFSLIVSDTNLFAATTYGVYRSSLVGADNMYYTTWMQVLAPSPWTLTLTAGHDTSGTYLLVGVGNENPGAGAVYLSRDNGTTWSIISNGVNGISTHMVDAIAVSPNESAGNIIYAGTWYEGVFCSTNYGESWKVINNGLINTTINSLYCFNNLLFAGTCGNGLFLSSNGGDNWLDVSAGLPSNSFINTILVSGQNIFVGTSGSGVWKRPISEMLTSVEDSKIKAVTKFYLNQNYPNPFNPSTKISWQTPVSGHQTLKIYDILGKEVATLVDEYKEAGRYEETYDASKLSSGIYFYKLQSGNFVEIKKMVLLK